MAALHDRRNDAELLPVRRVRLIEDPDPVLPPEHRREMDRLWDEAVAANPALFDGPAVACTEVVMDAGTLTLTWARVTYRHHALHAVPGAPARPMLFVAVAQPTVEGGLVVGQMAPFTASPLRWQLPGGGVEPPLEGEPLDDLALRRHAARELIEETGLVTPPEELTLLTVVRCENGNIGIAFQAPPRPLAVVQERFAAVVEAETAAGLEPELQAIALVESPEHLMQLSGPRADYLELVLALGAAARTACAHGSPGMGPSS